MKYKAVIFDLFGTLVESFSREEYDQTVINTALALDIPSELFLKLWIEESVKRNTGFYPTSRAVMEAMCEKLGFEADEEKIGRAVMVRYDFMRRVMVPRADALTVLTRLREAGMKTGLISNCSPVTEELWGDTPFPPYFDAAVFSSVIGCKKPDPRIYQAALEGLGVQAGDSLYVGDGDGNELTGARDIGMHPVMITVENDKVTRFDTGKQEWDGPVIGLLTEILKLAGV